MILVAFIVAHLWITAFVMLAQHEPPRPSLVEVCGHVCSGPRCTSWVHS